MSHPSHDVPGACGLPDPCLCAACLAAIGPDLGVRLDAHLARRPDLLARLRECYRARCPGCLTCRGLQGGPLLRALVEDLGLVVPREGVTP